MLEPNEHLLINDTSTTVGSVVRFSCDSGYELTGGQVSVTCQGDGSWSGHVPSCSRGIIITVS